MALIFCKGTLVLMLSVYGLIKFVAELKKVSYQVDESSNKEEEKKGACLFTKDNLFSVRNQLLKRYNQVV